MKAELLTLVVIAGFIAGSASGSTTFELEAKMDCTRIQMSLLVFRARNGRFPTETEGFEALVHNPDPENLPNWRQQMEKLPLDPWERPYQYLSPLPGQEDDYGIFSFGRDGVSTTAGNDADDVNSWSRVRIAKAPEVSMGRGVVLVGAAAGVLLLSLGAYWLRCRV
ncbi:MAG: type II secretion system protein GspG [Chthoniobacteraceae bacterium]